MTNKNLTQLELDFIASKKTEGKTVIVNGNVVIVKYLGDKGVAYCNPEDTFDITVGYNVACLKIKLQDSQKLQENKRIQKRNLEKKHKEELDKLENRLQKIDKEVARLKHQIKNPSKIKKQTKEEKMQEIHMRNASFMLEDGRIDDSVSLHGTPVGIYNYVRPLSLTLGTTDHLK